MWQERIAAWTGGPIFACQKSMGVGSAEKGAIREGACSGVVLVSFAETPPAGCPWPLRRTSCKAHLTCSALDLEQVLSPFSASVSSSYVYRRR